MKIDWGNTPGSYYAVAYLLGCCVMILNCPRKLDTKKTIFVVAGVGIMLCTLMMTRHSSPLFFTLFMLFYFALMCMTIALICNYNLASSLYFAARAFIMGEFIASFEWIVFYFLAMYTKIPVNRITSIVLLIVIDSILFIAFYKLEKKNREVNEHIRINTQELVSVVAITIAIFVVSNINYVMEGLNVAEVVISQVFIVRTLVDLGGVAIMYAFHMQLGELNMRYEVMRLQDMLEMQYNNYEVLEQSINAVNQKYHDLKYQIAVLKSEANKEDSIAYLDHMEQEIKAYEAQNKTGNKILDTILTGKTLYCQSNWIELTSVVDGALLDFMDPMDISILFGNMLDNAIESVKKIEQKERRLMHLAVTKQKGFLRIRMENCYEEKPEFKDGMPRTTKKDKQYHGFGLKSIQSTVKKYGGSTTIQAENGWFELRILIPMQ